MAETRLMTKEVEKEARSVLGRLTAPVKLVFFTQEHACGSCREQQDLLETLVSLSSRLTLETYELVRDSEKARDYGIDKVPATAVIGAKDYGIRFFGVTAGYEFGSLLEAIVMAGSGASGLSKELERLVRLIDRPVHLEVMVTLTCPYCPKMVRLAHQMSFVNEHVRGDMVDAAEFPQLAQRYDVHGVPRTVINGQPAFEGALEPAAAILQVLRTGNPAEYERIEAAIREDRGERLATAVRSDHEYDLIVVGAGPAAFSAAIYAARKNLDVALLGEHPGGQLTDTASVENWPGVPSIGGQELAEMFRHHAEHYRVAEQLHVRVEKIAPQAGGFLVTTADGASYRARAVVFSAGKQYRLLQVPGEERFIGRGIAFCATCDAPLYRDKRVAVIGGGNSAFTAVRDLLGYAREVHVFNILPDWQADPALLQEVSRAPQVHLHAAMRVVEFLGKDRLEGIRTESADGKDRVDFLVDGVFLEIGLVPNSGPVKDLASLNAAGEVLVDRDQATSIPGLFAAGDVTDEREKQIVVAAASGVKAALAAHRYLTEGPAREGVARPGGPAGEGRHARRARRPAATG